MTISIEEREKTQKERGAKRHRREQRIDRYIQTILKSPLPSFTLLPKYKVQSLLNASLDEKEAFFRAEGRRIIILLFAVALIWSGFSVYRAVFPASISKEPPGPTFESAGVIQDIQLHSTTFSTDTTVKTTTGIFQVRGGVSAAPGDTAKTKHEGLRLSLCIESKIKSQCYPIF